MFVGPGHQAYLVWACILCLTVKFEFMLLSDLEVCFHKYLESRIQMVTVNSMHLVGLIFVVSEII